MTKEQLEQLKQLIKDMIDGCENEWFLQVIYGLLERDYQERHTA